MPKIIPNAKEKILTSTKELLFKQGFEGLALRDIARASGVALGTIYNYFSSKDMLVASVMVKDWNSTLQNITTCCNEALSVEQGVRSMYDSITEYVDIYKSIRKEYKKNNYYFGTHHMILRNQLSEILKKLLVKFDYKEDLVLCPLLAETILDSAVQEDISYNELSIIINRVFKKQEEIL